MLFRSSIFFLGLVPCKMSVLAYQFSNAIGIHLLSLILSIYCSKGANHKDVKSELQSEYFLVRELTFSLARVSSFLFILSLVTVFGMSALKFSFYLFAFILLLFGNVLYQIVKDEKHNS